MWKIFKNLFQKQSNKFEKDISDFDSFEKNKDESVEEIGGLVEEKVIDFSAPLEVKLVKESYTKYNAQFFNPIRREWWIFPNDSATSEFWSLEKIGSYDAYGYGHIYFYISDIDELKKELESIKRRFPNLNFVKEYFEKLNLKKKERDEYFKKIDSLPDEI